MTIDDIIVAKKVLAMYPCTNFLPVNPQACRCVTVYDILIQSKIIKLVKGPKGSIGLFISLPHVNLENLSLDSSQIGIVLLR